jgi:alpha-glucuronidase
MASSALFAAGQDRAQLPSGDAAWLRYEPIADPHAREAFDALPATVVVLGDSAVLTTARGELIRGIQGMLGRTLRVETALPAEDAIVLGRLDDLGKALPRLGVPPDLAPEGFWLKTVRVDGRVRLLVAAPDARGVLYGTFALLRRIALRERVGDLDEAESPSAPVRWVDEWDNLDGTIERGYAGRSIFFEGGQVVEDLGRAAEYARLLASVGINACSISNVNADARLLTPDYLPQLARVAQAFRPWGVGLAVSIDFSSPKAIGGLDTFDPLDPRVAEWWRTTVDAVYHAVPDFAGFVLKADSEGRLGPAAYGRTHADAANVIARALKPHGGLLFYRGFVYDHHMDWRNLKNDRARAAYDNFAKLDGLFDDNVVVQIKHGPIDFQVREPASPLFGALEKTNQAIELQITQEYLGQQRHLCYLVPMWKAVLDFEMAAAPGGSPVKDLVAGKTFHRPSGGFVGVSNVGREATWLGHPLAMANLYGFGRLAWNPDLGAARIAEEWTRLTFGDDPHVVNTIVGMQLRSWPAHEAYTGPLGAGTLTDILGPHFGPGIESSERNGWGQWHRADHQGIGMDRTVATGTGFIGQYRPPVAAVYESLASCPDELLLFMHHVPYTYVLHSGKTVIQHVYDSHYEGAATAAAFVKEWESLRGLVDPLRFEEVLERQEFQAGHARVWRDAICSWFLRMSGIPDERGRAGSFPGRIEAEAMDLEGYEARDVTPWETASGGRDVECGAASRRCAASFVFRGTAGWHDVAVQYFDENDGVSRYRLRVGTQVVDEWSAADHLPTKDANGHSSSRRMVRGLALRPGDRVRIEAEADGGENAPIDYVEIDPQP